MSPSLLALIRKVGDAPVYSLGEDDLALVQASLVAEYSNSAIPISLMTDPMVLSLGAIAVRLPVQPTSELLVTVSSLSKKDLAIAQLLLAFLSLKCKTESWPSLSLQSWMSSTQGFVPDLSSVKLSRQQRLTLGDPASWSS